MLKLPAASMVAVAFLLAGCASTPDPAKVCTAEWIQPRADRAVERIEKKTAKTFRAVRKAGASYVEGKEPGPLTLLSLRRSLNDLQDELTDGQGIRDLRTIARTCDDPDFIRGKLDELLERQQVPAGVMSFMERFGILDSLVRMAEGAGDRMADGDSDG